MLGLHLLSNELPGFGLEDGGKTHKEIERVYYALISDKGFEQLKSNGLGENQEQWNFKTEKGSCRVRAYRDSKRYEATVKSGDNETNSEVSEDFFNHFKSISDNGMIKKRFTYPIDTSKYSSEDKLKWEGLKWEVDVFFLPNGEFAPWCKIDLEVHTEDQLSDGTRPAFPIDLKEVVVNEGEAKKLVRRLYEDFFITKNNVSLESIDMTVAEQVIESGAVKFVSPNQLKVDDLIQAFKTYEQLRTDDYGSDAYKDACKVVCELLHKDGGVLDTFVALYKKGPLDSGDLPSKGGRDVLVEAGICTTAISEGEWCHAITGICDGLWSYGVENGFFGE